MSALLSLQWFSVERTWYSTFLIADAGRSIWIFSAQLSGKFSHSCNAKNLTLDHSWNLSTVIEYHVKISFYPGTYLVISLCNKKLHNEIQVVVP